jgi:hypothetical protein
MNLAIPKIREREKAMRGKSRKNSTKGKSDVVATHRRRRLREKPEPLGEDVKVSKGPETVIASAESASRGPFLGTPSLLQSSYGIRGNFELVVPLAAGGIAYFWRNNDDEKLPWNGPVEFGADAGRLDGVSLIQGDFGEKGNLELVAADRGGHELMHFWRDGESFLGWYGPRRISEKSLVPIFSGNPALVWGDCGRRGNFDLVVPRASGGFSYYWRDNDDPALPWCGPLEFATDAGVFDSVTMIQSNFGEPGHLEIVARTGDQLAFFWGELGEELKWHGPEIIATGIAGTPSMIQSNFGGKGNFDLVVPLASGGLGYFWRDNDDPQLHWYGPLMFGMNAGKVDGVSLIQSNFGEPGHLELAAQVEGRLAFFWRDSGTDLRWNGPLYLDL